MEDDIHSAVLDRFPWLVHGFGTRASRLPDFPLAQVKQIHSAEVLDARGQVGFLGEADALISAEPGLAVGVRTADCVPILLADPVQRVVAAVHAGWRGTVAEIVRLTVEKMVRDYGTHPDDMAAAIGPSIGESCFEVGPEVAQRFAKWNAALEGTDRKAHLNLAEVNFNQLVLAGLLPGNVDLMGLCTMCDSETFYSFRREREQAGRMMSWIVVRRD